MSYVSVLKPIINCLNICDMKKVIFMLAAIMASGMFCSCEEGKTPEENAYELLLDKRGPARIEKIYSIVMRLDIPYPFPHYVIRFDNGDNTYFRKSKVDYTLRAGDRVDYYWTYKLAPAEIYELCSEQGAMRQDDIDGSSKPLARGLIISDKKRGRIVDMFRMSVRFGIPFVPLDCLFAELEDGSLVYMKEYKNDDLHIGDRIIYTTWVLYPNEVVTVTKDDGETDNPPLV